LPAHANINEFLNRCENDNEGINFLQDSEIILRQQQQQQQHQQQQHETQPSEADFQQQQQHQQSNFGNYAQEVNPSEENQDDGFRTRGANNARSQLNGQRQQYQNAPVHQQRPYNPEDRRGPPRSNNGPQHYQRNNSDRPQYNSGSRPAGSQQQGNVGLNADRGYANPNPSGSRNPNSGYRGSGQQGSGQTGYRSGQPQQQRGTGSCANTGARGYQQQTA